MKFGQLTGLTVFKLPCTYNPEHRERRVACVCECGNMTAPLVSSLVHNRTTSCGCIAKAYTKKFTDEWAGMKGNNARWKNKKIK